jgi:hypothetical protein
LKDSEFSWLRYFAITDFRSKLLCMEATDSIWHHCCRDREITESIEGLIAQCTDNQRFPS